jgi:hypothetical protein
MLLSEELRRIANEIEEADPECWAWIRDLRSLADRAEDMQWVVEEAIEYVGKVNEGYYASNSDLCEAIAALQSKRAEGGNTHG